MTQKSNKIVHLPENCIGCNACVLIAPGKWRMNGETGKAELINGKEKGRAVVAELLEHEVEDNQKAAEACPMGIIKIEGN